MDQLQTWTPIALSAVSLIAALTALYLNRLQGPRVAVDPGVSADVDLRAGGGVDLYLTVTFMNQGARSGPVQLLVLALRHAADPDRTHLLEAAAFYQVAEKDGRRWYQMVSRAHPLVVPPNGHVTQTIRFVWPDGESPFHLGEGAVTLEGWVYAGDAPARRAFATAMTLTPAVGALLAGEPGENPTVSLPLARERLSGLSLSTKDAKKRLARPPKPKDAP